MWQSTLNMRHISLRPFIFPIFAVLSLRDQQHPVPEGHLPPGELLQGHPVWHEPAAHHRHQAQELPDQCGVPAQRYMSVCLVCVCVCVCVCVLSVCLSRSLSLFVKPATPPLQNYVNLNLRLKCSPTILRVCVCFLFLCVKPAAPSTQQHCTVI